MKAGELPVPEALKNQDWDAVIAKAEEFLTAKTELKEVSRLCGILPRSAACRRITGDKASRRSRQ